MSDELNYDAGFTNTLLAEVELRRTQMKQLQDRILELETELAALRGKEAAPELKWRKWPKQPQTLYAGFGDCRFRITEYVVGWSVVLDIPERHDFGVELESTCSSVARAKAKAKKWAKRIRPWVRENA